MNKIYIFGIDSVRGGIELLMKYFIDYLSKTYKNKEVIIVTCYEKIAFEEEYLDKGVKIIRTPSKKQLFSYYKSLKTILGEATKNDVIYLNLSSYCNVFLLKAAKKTKGKVIIHGHNAHTANVFKKIIHKISRTKYRKLGYKIAVSKPCDNFMFKGHADKIIYNGIESKLFYFGLNNRQSIREQLKISKDKIVVGCIGRISKEKNQLYLVKKANKYPDYLFLFIGKFVDSKYKRVIEKNAPDNCLFVGQKDDVGAYLSSLDAVVIPSKFEAYSLIALESLTNGLPVFLYDGLYRQLASIFENNENIYTFNDEFFTDALLSSFNHKRNSGEVIAKSICDILEWTEEIKKII